MKGAKFNKAWFHSVDWTNANLEEAELSETFLRYGTFVNANFSKAQLRQSDMWGVIIRHADLSSADCSNVKAEQAQFIDSDLSRADFSGADLSKAEFVRCNLEGTVFDKANIRSALFENNKGMGEGAEKKLARKSQRRRYELGQSIGAFINKTYLFFYAAFLILTAIGLFRWVKSDFGFNKIRWGITISNILCLGPLAWIVLMYVSGISPVMQLNAGSDVHMDVWMAWSGMFMPLLVITQVAFLIALVSSLTIGYFILTERIKDNKAWFLFYPISGTGLAFFSFYTLIQFSPSV